MPEPFEVLIEEGYDREVYLSSLEDKAKDPPYTWPCKVWFKDINGNPQATISGWLYKYSPDHDEIWLASRYDGMNFRIVGPSRVLIMRTWEDGEDPYA